MPRGVGPLWGLEHRRGELLALEWELSETDISAEESEGNVEQEDKLVSIEVLVDCLSVDFMLDSHDDDGTKRNLPYKRPLAEGGFGSGSRFF